MEDVDLSHIFFHYSPELKALAIQEDGGQGSKGIKDGFVL